MNSLKNHPYLEKYDPENYQPEVYDFLADFSDIELAQILEIPNFSNQAHTEQNLQNITEIVHSKYTYKKRIKGNLALSPETIGERGELDCYGFTLALSQALNMLNINHKIAFANTHAFVLANNYNTFYLLDALSPEISGEISTSNICHEDCVNKNIFSINMLKHIDNQPGSFNKMQFLREHPWTNFSKNQNRLGSGRSEELRPSANSNIYLRTYSPYDGSKALYAYDQYKVAIEQKNFPRPTI